MSIFFVFKMFKDVHMSVLTFLNFNKECVPGYLIFLFIHIFTNTFTKNPPRLPLQKKKGKKQ